VQNIPYKGLDECFLSGFNLAVQVQEQVLRAK